MTAPRRYPALALSWPVHPGEDAIERVLAELDDFHPTAIEETSTGIRAFFPDTAGRDDAARAIARAHPDAAATTELVDDDAWAERSQAALTAVTVGRIVVRPPWAPVPPDAGGALAITIQPSMGFGTGHHQTTRLCLRALQALPLEGRSVLDVGTGSGVLAIAAARLGAARVVGVDDDADALTAAAENLELNGAVDAVELGRADAAATPAPPIPGGADVVLANLTGALLERLAPLLAGWIGPGGRLVASGFQTDDEPAVVAALRAAGLVPDARLVEDDWVAVTAIPTPSTAR